MSEIDTETIAATTAGSPVDEPVEGDDAIGSDKASQGLLEARDRYRSQRDEARTERDTIASRLVELQTRELHRLAGEYLSAPEDIDLSGKPLSDYLTPEGWVDHEAVRAAANAVIASRPGLSKHSPAHDRSQGLGTGQEFQPTTFEGLFDAG